MNHPKHAVAGRPTSLHENSGPPFNPATAEPKRSPKRLRCSRCIRLKPVTAFYPHRRIRRGYQHICKVCSCQVQKDYHTNHIIQERARSYRYYETHREARRAHARKYQREHAAAGRTRLYKRNETPKGRAGQIVRDKVQRGLLQKPKRCTECGKAVEARKLEGHHPDYAKPLEVNWLCTICHGKKHRLPLEDSA